MHNSYYLIRKVSEELKKRILGWEIAKCYSQNKDELILHIHNDIDEIFIRADQRSSFSCMSFPDELHRAQKNSVDLFRQVSGCKIIDIFQYPNERAFHIELEGEHILLFKLFGNQSNVILYKSDSILEIFKNNLKKDSELSLRSLGRVIRQDRDNFVKNKGDIGLIYPTFNKMILQFLSRKGYETLSLDEKWDLVQRTTTELDSNKFYIYRSGDIIKLTLIDQPESIRTEEDPLLSLTLFYQMYIRNDVFIREKKSSLSQINRAILSGRSYVQKNQNKLSTLQSDTGYDKIGDILMANLHNIDPRMEEVRLHNFYTNDEITIKLKRGLSPQKLAENYYRKSKNQGKEIAILETNIQSKSQEVRNLENLKLAIENVQDLKSLRLLAKTRKMEQEKSKKSPYKLYQAMGFDILVGRNAKNNDALTFRTASKEDMWLHARGVAGSHVIIKNKPGSPYPKPVIEKSAQLAAHYSKHRNESTSPVIYTLKKYVRKRKGMVTGEVIVEKEKVILVQPRDYPD